LLVGLIACAGPPSYPARPLLETAPASGIAHGSGFWDGSGGTKLFEQWWTPASSDSGASTAQRTVFVIVHGLKDHSSRYGVLAERLARKGYAVYAFDLRGHAHSSGQRVGIESFDEYIDDLTRFMSRVKDREKGAKVILFGHSMGGAIATLWTIEKQPDLAGLVLSGAALKVNVSFVKVSGTKATAALFPRAPVFNLDLDRFSRDPAVVKECKADGFVYPDGAPARTANELLGAIRRIEERMESVKVPLLVLHGAADEVTDPDGSKELVARAGTRDKTLKLYPSLVHDLLHEPEKEIVMKDIETFVDAHAR
jgi:alpha-beta hydrolase superfamily lysophospholipase